MKFTDRELIIEGLKSRIAKTQDMLAGFKAQLQTLTTGKFETKHGPGRPPKKSPAKKSQSKKKSVKRPKMSAERRAVLSEQMKEYHRKRKAQKVPPTSADTENASAAEPEGYAETTANAAAAGAGNAD